MPQAEADAAQLVDPAAAGRAVPAVARQFSAASTAANGGDAGWLTASELAPEVRAGRRPAAPGRALQADPDVKDGVYIIFLRDKHAGGAPSWSP